MKVEVLGLNRAADDWIEENIVTEQIFCQHCGKQVSIKPNYEIYNIINVTDEEKLGLARYMIKDGRWVYEVVQSIIFDDENDSAYIFLGLSKTEKQEDVFKDMTWSENEINDEIDNIKKYKI